MTIEDARVIGLGSLTLLIVFLTVGAIYASGSLDIWGIVRRYVMVKIADAELVLDDMRTSSNGGSSGSGDLVPGQQHHAEPGEPGDLEPDEKSFARQLEREELIIMLAVQRRPNGDYLYSANDITKFVGGAAASVKNTIANVRGRKETPPPAKSLSRPVNGW